MKRLSQPVIAFCVILLSLTGFIVSDTSNLQEAEPPADSPEVADVQQTQPQSTPGSDIPGNTGDPGYTVIDTGPSEFRALWVATVLNLDFPTKQGLSAAALKREIDAIVATTLDLGLNAIVLQVRPAGDAFYKSNIFPWSRWLSGEQGVGIQDFDPLAYWLEVCHAGGVELHAWINPYRIIHTSDNSSDPDTLAPNNPVRLSPGLAVGWTGSDGRSGLFLDPGLPEARRLIIDGISELISNYDVDGIHIDDYFYPGADFNDAASYAEYGGGMELDDWRRNNVNELIRGIGSIIREHNTNNSKNVRWGVSPTAIWKNGSSDPLGVPGTSGQESYHALYADTRRWVTEQWVDYICPQIYWYIGYDIADFEAIFNWWSELCKSHYVDLYIGHAAYREFEDNQPPNWRGEIVRQLEMIAGSDVAKGSIFYRYFSLRSSVGASVRGFYEQKDNSPQQNIVLSPDSKLSVGFPADDDTITGTPSTVAGYNIIGTCFPDRPLYLNGQEVTTRTADGYFHVFTPLEQGENVFTFTQQDAEPMTRIVTLKAPASGGGGSTPKATVTNVTALDYATVTSDEAWVYSSNSTSSNLGFMLERGQRDRVVARSDNNFLRLSCGIWVSAGSVTVQREDSAVTDVLSSGVYRSGADFDVIAWTGSEYPAAITSFDGDELTIHFGLQNTVPSLELPSELEENTVFQNARSGTSGDVPYYEFTLKDDARFEGCYTAFEDGEFRLYLKKRKSLADGEMPLTDITIMLDAGHGGEFSGAVGPLGNDYPEKDINLENALKLAAKLESLGAGVILTRSDDSDVSLQERVNMSRQVKPDLFISLHANSVAETTNASSIRGFTVWYYTANSAAMAETALDVLHFINPGTNRQRIINQAHFVVCRPWWSPHVLFEASFMMSLEDFTWLTDPVQQERFADAAADAILDYFAAPTYP